MDDLGDMSGLLASRQSTFEKEEPSKTKGHFFVCIYLLFTFSIYVTLGNLVWKNQMKRMEDICSVDRSMFYSFSPARSP